MVGASSFAGATARPARSPATSRPFSRLQSGAVLFRRTRARMRRSGKPTIAVRAISLSKRFVALGAALESLQADGVNPKALDITRLWALTGCRRDEIAALKWSEVDFERGCLVLEDSKTGESVRPLATPALVMLDALPRYGAFLLRFSGNERRSAFPRHEEDLAQGHGRWRSCPASRPTPSDIHLALRLSRLGKRSL